MVDWSRPYSVEYLCDELDMQTGLSKGQLDLLSCSVACMDDGIGATASIETANPVDEVPVRIYARVEQNGTVETADLFTGIASSTGRKWTSQDATYGADCYGVLQFADEKLLDRGWWCGKGVTCSEMAVDLLKRAMPPWVRVYATGESPKTASAIHAEDDETPLSMARLLLDGCGWGIRVHGDGAIEVCERGVVRATIDVNDNDILFPDMDDNTDRFKVPNVMRAIDCDGNSVVVRDKALIEKRGREIWAQVTGVALSDDQTLDSYARAELAARNDASREVSWSREYVPGVLCGDSVRALLVAYQIDGRFYVSSQNIDCGEGIKVTETVVERG